MDTNNVIDYEESACLTPMANSKDCLQLRGTLRGHSDWVTQMVVNPKDESKLVSCSRDQSLIIWKLEPTSCFGQESSASCGKPIRRLKGHSHFVSDVTLSTDGQFALSSSWDKTLRLWDIEKGISTRRFEGHTKDVLSVAFSADNRQICSGSRDSTVKLWNTLASCKFTFEGHNSWVSCVRFSPNLAKPSVASCAWDHSIKVWDITTCKLESSFTRHSGYVNSICVSPDGSLMASGGKDTKAMLWDLNEHKLLYTLPQGDIINALAFSPNRYWLCVASGPSIKIWDLESKKLLDDLKHWESKLEESKKVHPQCISLAWSMDGQTLFSGYADNVIRVWKVSLRHG